MRGREATVSMRCMSAGARYERVSQLRFVSGRRLVVLARMVVIVVVLLVTCATSSALAAKGVVGSFGETGTAAGAFSASAGGAGGTAVNQGGTGGVLAGDVYVVDRGNNRVEEFTKTGEFVRTFGLNVGGLGVNVCTSLCVAGTASATAGGMSAPQGVAIEQTNGNVYVTDQGNRRVDVFTAVGLFEGAWGWNTADNAGKFEFCTATCQAGASGANAGEFGSLIGYPAVDPSSGNVYVADSANRRIDEFSVTLSAGAVTAAAFLRGYGWGASTGAAAFQICTSTCHAANTSAGTDPGHFGSSSPTRVAVDGSGFVYAIDNGNLRVQKFDSSGNPVAIYATAQLSGSPSPTDVAVNPANNHVLVVKPCNATICPTAANASERHVLEFDSGGTLLDTGAANGEITAVNGLIAASGAAGNVYLTSTTGKQRVFIINTIVPPVATIEAATGLTASEAMLHGHINPEGFETSYQFEYSVDGVTWTKAPVTAASVGSGVAEIPVTTAIGGLEGNTVYQMRLSAKKPFGAGSATSTQKSFTTLGAPPTVTESKLISATSVSTSVEATLMARINPQHQNTTYHFEYGLTSSYGMTAPIPDASMGSAILAEEVQETLTTLEANTEYHYRVVATNAAGTTDGPDEKFMTDPVPSEEQATGCPNAKERTGPSAALPDCRAYEQVTPTDKGATTDLFSRSSLAIENPDHGSSAEDGNSFLLHAAYANFGGGVSEGNVYVFRRNGNGWAGGPVVPPGDEVHAITPSALNPADGFSQVAVTDRAGSEALEHVGATFTVNSLLGAPGGPYTTLVSSPSIVGVAANNSISGMSKDATHAVLESHDHGLVTAASGLDHNSMALYDYQRLTEQISLIDVKTDGSLVSECGARLGQGSSAIGDAHNAVSTDGTRIVFTAPDPYGVGPAGCWDRTTDENAPQIYMRSNDATTVDISGEPEPGVSDPTLHPAIYLGADASDSRVYFASETELTPDDTGHSLELYEYDVAAHKVRRVSTDESGSVEGKLDFVGAISNTEGAHGVSVYFAAFGQLRPGLPALNEHEAYLYRYDSAGDAITFVSTVPADDYPLPDGVTANVWYIEAIERGGDNALELGPSARANWFTTNDGEYLLFPSNTAITGYNSTPLAGVKCEESYQVGTENTRCVELYRYSATDNSIVCVSCGSVGSSPIDNSVFDRSAIQVAPGASATRPISDDGHVVVFETKNPLVPEATSAHVHVYEWRDGKLSLISAPGDPSNAFFLGMSTNASDIFIGSQAQLVGADTDVSGDLYDARVDGGFASVAPTVCSGSGCQGVPQTPPIFRTPSSVTFEGVGNFVEIPQKVDKQTGNQKLAKALRTCRKEHNKRKRKACEKQARRRYSTQAGTKANRRGK